MTHTIFRGSGVHHETGSISFKTTTGKMVSILVQNRWFIVANTGINMVTDWLPAADGPQKTFKYLKCN